MEKNVKSVTKRDYDEIMVSNRRGEGGGSETSVLDADEQLDICALDRYHDDCLTEEARGQR